MSDTKSKASDKVRIFNLEKKGEKSKGESSIHIPEPEFRDREPHKAVEKKETDKDSKPQSTSHAEVETLQQYISLKEVEIRDLKEQNKQYKTLSKKYQQEIEDQKQKNQELVRDVEAEAARAKEAGIELEEIHKKYEAEIALLKNDFEDKVKRSEWHQTQLKDLEKRREEWKERLREDLKKIRLKERELENKHELLKRDTQALLDSKDKHILELKKKNDAFELELESFEERLRRSNIILNQIDGKKKRLIETMKLVLVLLEELGQETPEDQERKVG